MLNMWMLVGMAVLLALSWLAVALMYRRLRAVERVTAERIEQMQTELHQLGNSAIGVGQHVLKMERRLKQLRAGTSTANVVDGEFPYSQAADLFRDEGLAKSGGVSAAERHLLSLVRENGKHRGVA